MASPGPGGEPAGGPQTERGVPHGQCIFTGRALCTCIYGSSIAAQQQEQRQQGQAPDGGTVAADIAAAARQHMLQARAAWRLLHGPDSSQEPVAIMLPKLERQAPTPVSAEAAAAAAAAAAAKLERAEAAARAAVLRAATLAGAAGLPYRPPEGLGVDLSGISVANLSELEQQVEAVRRAQEARQAAAAAAAAAAQTAGGAALPLPAGGLPQLPPAGEAPPMVLPLAALVHGPQGAPATATPEAPEGVPAAGGTPSERPASGSTSGRQLRRTRSHDVAGSTPPGALAQGNLSMPLPELSSSMGGRGGLPQSGSRPRRSPAGKPPAKPASARAGRGAGPGKGPRGKGGKQVASAHEGHAPPGSAERPSSQPADLSRFGEGYQPRGPSAASPPKSWLLKAKDMKAGLQGKLVQTLWPDVGQWWPAVVLHVSTADKSLTLLYETGDEEAVQYPLLVQAGEVAWLLGPSGAPTARAAARSPSSNRASQQQQQQGGTPPSSGRRQPSAGRGKSPQHASTASAPAAAPAATVASQLQQQEPHIRAASGELGLSNSLGEPGGQLQHGWPPLGDAMDLDADERASSPQLLGGSGPVGTISEGTGALLQPLSVGGGHGFGSSMRLGGHRGSELLLVDNPALGGLGLLPSMHLDSPAELPQQAGAQQQQQEPPPAQQQQQRQQQQAPAQQLDGPEEQPPVPPDCERPKEAGQQQEQQLGVQEGAQEEQAMPQPQPLEQHDAATAEPTQQMQQEAAQEQEQQQPGSPELRQQSLQGQDAAAEQRAAGSPIVAEQQPAAEECSAPPSQEQQEQREDSVRAAGAAPAEASAGSAEPVCADGMRCSPPDGGPCPTGGVGCQPAVTEAEAAAGKAPAVEAGSSAPDSTAMKLTDGPEAAADEVAGSPGAAEEAASAAAAAAEGAANAAAAADEPAEAPDTAVPEPPQAPAPAADAATAVKAEEQPAQRSASEAARPQQNSLQGAGSADAGRNAPSEQQQQQQQQAEQSEGQPPPPPPPPERLPSAPAEDQPPPPPAAEPEGAAPEQPQPAAEQPPPPAAADPEGAAAEQPQPAEEQPSLPAGADPEGAAAEQPQPAADALPASADGAPATQLPPTLAAAAAQPPPGYRLARAGELLELGPGAVGRLLAVATLPSGDWQLARVRQCSALHGLLQVQFEQEGMLLTAQEEGATFLLSVPLNGSPPA